MKGDAAIVQALNDVLTAELTAINQYYVHYKMCENWGYLRMAGVKRKESIEEMQHADAVIERILYLDGVPNMQRLNPVKVGENVVEQHELDLQLEYDNVKRLNDAIALCLDKRDAGSRELLERILHDEEEAVDFLEGQLGIVKDIGKERYLAEQMGDLPD
ncbi:MAG: bacterioferritin [Planctomycetes bacterium]|nr:bacterioferritin [Planctomycetota bacterium]